jgi:hypothetical protein
LCFVGAGYYAFVHRTFLEFFCAWSFAWQFKETQSLGIEGLINDVFADHWRDEKWHEVLRLIAGMIDAKFVGDIISYLMEQDGEEEKFQNLFLAGKCLFEVRSLQGIDDVESRLLNRLKYLTGYELGYFYEPYDENADLVCEIRTQAVEIVATTWRDDPTYTWLKQRVVSDGDEHVRREVVRQIATGWKHEPGILDLLKQWVVSDDSEYVRGEAVRQIATSWKHEPGILDLLKQWVVSDDSGYVRGEAVRQIATSWKHEPGILDLLKQRVVSDNSEYVRGEAVRQIATGWKHEPGILDLLKQWVVSDDSGYVRREALRQITTGWKHQPGTFELFYDNALNNPFKRKYEFETNPRQTALKLIVEQYPDHPQTLSLLQDRAENDPDEQLQEWAKNKLLDI